MLIIKIIHSYSHLTKKTIVYLWGFHIFYLPNLKRAHISLLNGNYSYVNTDDPYSDLPYGHK